MGVLFEAYKRCCCQVADDSAENAELADNAANAILLLLHETDPDEFFRCLTWFIEAVPPPSVSAPAGEESSHE